MTEINKILHWKRLWGGGRKGTWLSAKNILTIFWSDTETPVVFPAQYHSLMLVSVAEELEEGCGFALVLQQER